FNCAVLGGCHLHLLGGTNMRRVVFYSFGVSDMLRRRHCFGVYVAGGESGGGGLKSPEV
ncbi:hypothetical protein CFC21_001974, partial [Triticum aestivum]